MGQEWADRWPVRVAAQSAGQAPLGDVLVWLGVLLIVLIAGAIVIFAIRRRLLADERDSRDGGLTLHSLRTMHARGELTDEEFDRAKAALLEPMTRRDVAGRRARPGYDLTGERLPERAGDAQDDETEAR